MGLVDLTMVKTHTLSTVKGNSRMHGTQALVSRDTMLIHQPLPAIQLELHYVREGRPAGTWGTSLNMRVPIPIEAEWCNCKDTKAMTIQRLRTADFVDNYPPLPRHFGLKPAYFKTNNRANRDSDTNQINPTKPYTQCIIGRILGIPSCAISTRHNTHPSHLLHLNFLNDIRWSMGTIDRWDSCDMIQSLMTALHLTSYQRLIKYILFYGNKKKQRRLNSERLKTGTLKELDF